MCPEYLSSGHYDGRAEVYSYGLVLAELLSGRVQPVEVAFRGGLQYYVWDEGEWGAGEGRGGGGRVYLLYVFYVHLF